MSIRKQWRHGLAACALGLFAQAAAAQCKVQALDIPVRLVDQRPLVTLTIEGRELTMLLDTGAHHSMLMPSTAAELHLPTRKLPSSVKVLGFGGAVEAKLTTVKSLNFQGLPLKDADFIVGGNEIGSGIQGLIGRNLLSFADMEYDLANGRARLLLRKGNCKGSHPVYWADQQPVIEADLMGEDDEVGALRVRARINDRKLVAFLDTGAPMSVLMLDAAKRAGIKPGQLEAQDRIGGAGAGSVASWTAPVDRFELGGQKVSNLRVRVADAKRDDGDDLILGLDYFLAHRILVSREDRKLYATWNGGSVFSSGAVTDGKATAPEDADALARQAAAATAKGDLEGALSRIDGAIALAPAHAEHRMQRARLQLQRKQAALAAVDLDAALRLQPDLHAARLLRAQAHVEQEQREAALADLKALDQALGARAHERFDMAAQYAELALLPEALRQWELWLSERASDSGRAEALSARCRLRARLGQQLDLALKDCEAAIAQDGEMAAFHDSLGWLQLRRGEAQRALEAFDKATRLDAKSAASRYGRALAQRRLGNEGAARSDLEQARAMKSGIEAELAKVGFGALAAQ